MYRRIIVAVGDYPQLDTPVAYAIALAAHTDAELWLLRVLTVPLIFGAPDMITCAPLAMEHVAVEYVLRLADAAGLDACVLRLGICWPSCKVPSLRHITRASPAFMVPCPKAGSG